MKQISMKTKTNIILLSIGVLLLINPKQAGSTESGKMPMVQLLLVESPGQFLEKLKPKILMKEEKELHITILKLGIWLISIACRKVLRP